MYKSLNDFVRALEKGNELFRIKEFVDPVLEITEVTDRVSKQAGGGKALLFENTGTAFPLLINSLGSYKRICMALGVNNLDDVGKELEFLFKGIIHPKDSFFDKLKTLSKLSKLASWMPKKISGRGSCQEVIIDPPDITKLPVLQCWPKDGGRFITLPMVNTKDPETGIRNVGMYRMQIFRKDLTGMHWHIHKVGARHFSEYKKIREKMPIAVTLGGDPVYMYSATAPLPDNTDEYLLAGFLRKKKIELVQCITQDIDVPSDVDFVIEGYVDPEEDFIWEGPFGDHTGFYSLADWYPKFHITCITHKKNAIYPATIVGIPPQEDAWIAKATERIFLAPIKMAMLPEVLDIDIPTVGVAHNFTIVKIKKSFPGHAKKVMNALWGAGQMMLNKILIIVDGVVDIHNYLEVLRTVIENTNPESDISFTTGPLDVLDHSAPSFAYGSKMCIDATGKWKEEITNHPPPSLKLGDILFDNERIKRNNPGIHDVNSSLLKINIPLVIVSVEVKEITNIYQIYESLKTFEEFRNVVYFVFVNRELDVNNIEDVTWIVGNNLDPYRDTLITKTPGKPGVVIDATRKTRNKDKFSRDWPNIVTSNEETIKKIDTMWNKLGFWEFIPSPSLKYKKLVIEGGAIALE